MIKAVVVPSGIDLAAYVVDIDPADVYAYRRYIGGGELAYLELTSWRTRMYVDRSGDLRVKSLNARATSLAWLAQKNTQHRPMLAGGALLTGELGGHGQDTSLPAEILTLFTHRGLFAIEAMLHRDDRWMSNSYQYPGWYEAVREAVNMADRWEQFRDVRVVAK